MQHNQAPSQDDGRRSRFAFDHPSAFGSFRESSLPAALRDRAASQPPRGLTETLSARPDSASRRFESPFGAPGTPPPLSAATVGPGSVWSPARHASFHMNHPASPASTTGVGAFPSNSRTAAMRSLSFSTSSDLPSRLQSFMRDSFPSTFEDDEDEYDVLTEFNGLGNPDLTTHPAYNRQPAHIHTMSMSGTRDYTHPLRGTRAAALAAADNSSRSRSQSLAATNRRQLPGGMASSMSNTLPSRGSASLMQDWGDLSGSSAMNSGARTIPATNRAQGSNPTDLSNMSPFVRDLDGILRDDLNGLGSGILKDYWGIAGREDGGGSGTTSRRHSVSVVQPRTRRSSTVAGFSGNGLVLGTAVEDGDDTSPPMRNMDGRRMVGGGRTAGLGGGYSGAGPFATGRFGSGLGRSTIADDELADDLNSLSLSQDLQTLSQAGAPSRVHPSSLPAYGLGQQAQLSQSPGERITPTNGDYRTIQPASPSVRHPLSAGTGMGDGFASQQLYGDTRRPSASPNQFARRAVSRERDSSLAGIGEEEGFSSRLPSGTSQAAFRQMLEQQQAAQWGGTEVQQTRQGLAPGGNRLPSPTSQRAQALGAGGPTSPSYFNSTTAASVANRSPYGYTSTTSPSAQPISAVANAGRSGSLAGAGPGSLSHIQTNVGGQPGGGKYAQSKSPVDRFHAQHQLGQMHQAPSSAQSPTSASNPALNDLGRGVPLHRIASSTPMFIVEFKAGRSDIFFCNEPALAESLSVGDLVIVEADRGKDLGTITRAGITGEDVETFQRMQLQSQMAGEGGEEMISPVRTFGKEIMPKRLYGKATQTDVDLLPAKAQDEAKALQLCQGKVRAKKLPMEVVEAEYQWDRRKLTFYFVSDRRIDFRELVRELFRLYKTRIWMACLQGPSGSES
ncbi:hypothetical protein M407DRAFT_24909 [Tulasnella calospora MUT 4182]|uniref:PSP1 C-terminal domain-containing protein n=1 Tax=Tulasnella calospora MUT 4182 TaxID=1051891 RepID=A0A0C3QH24_9AGAM|nr:hypothetical protein M407DRAFT_24909 [Tulasnella calospora MUT 4182]